MCQHHSNAMIEDEICEQQQRIEHLMLEKDPDHMLFRSPSSPRMTICQMPQHSIEEQEPLAPLPTTPSSPIPSQFQRDDKLLRWNSTPSVYFPHLPVDMMILEDNHDSKKRMNSDLSSLPLPKHIRLLPRRRKSVQRNHRN